MDWGKQDNELRKLLEGNDFLPEGENWDAINAWNKFLDTKQEANKNRRRWLPLVAAACVAALAGLFFWLSVPNVVQNDITTKEPVVVPSAAKGATQPMVTEPGSENTTIEEAEAEVAALNNGASASSPSLIKNKKLPVIEKVNETAGLDKANSVVTVSVAPPEMVNPTSPALVQTGSEINTSQPQVTVAKKPTIKVVHYNTLNNSSPITPPVFVKLTRSESKWQMQELQDPANAKQPEVLLKIDLSPVPKKSL
jgi:hypothetical protein